MTKSTVEKLNELKEKELNNIKSIPATERDIEKNDPASVVDDISTFTESPATRARKHKDPIGIDKEPGV